MAVPAPPGDEHTIVIANGTKAPLSCRIRGEASDWTGYEAIAPGFALFAPSQAGGKSYLECKAPVSPTVYAMLAGQHYVLIREKAGAPVEVRAQAMPTK